MEGGRGGGGRVCTREGKKKKTQPLGPEVITVLCTQNNWSHQCGCHTECLAVPRHRCSPLLRPKPTNQTQTSGQETRSLPRIIVTWGENDPPMFTPQLKLCPVRGRQRHGVLQIRSSGRRPHICSWIKALAAAVVPQKTY